MHATIEEESCYPRAQEAIAAEDLVLEADDGRFGRTRGGMAASSPSGDACWPGREAPAQAADSASVLDLFEVRVPVAELLIHGSAIFWFLFLLFRFVIRLDFGALGIADVLLLVIVGNGEVIVIRYPTAAHRDGVHAGARKRTRGT